MSKWTWFWIILGVIVACYFVYAGYFMRLSNYVQETKEELKKCTWPTWSELKGSTVVVIISVGLLGAFTVGVDKLFGLIAYLLA